MATNEWFTDHENIVLTARYMADHLPTDANDIADMVEKPWKYTEEYLAALSLPDEESPESRSDETVVTADASASAQDLDPTREGPQ